MKVKLDLGRCGGGGGAAGVRWHKPFIPAAWEWRQGDCKFKAHLGWSEFKAKHAGILFKSKAGREDREGSFYWHHNCFRVHLKNRLLFSSFKLFSLLNSYGNHRPLMWSENGKDGAEGACECTRKVHGGNAEGRFIPKNHRLRFSPVINAQRHRLAKTTVC